MRGKRLSAVQTLKPGSMFVFAPVTSKKESSPRCQQVFFLIIIGTAFQACRTQNSYSHHTKVSFELGLSTSLQDV